MRLSPARHPGRFPFLHLAFALAVAAPASGQGYPPSAVGVVLAAPERLPSPRRRAPPDVGRSPGRRVDPAARRIGAVRGKETQALSRAGSGACPSGRRRPEAQLRPWCRQLLLGHVPGRHLKVRSFPSHLHCVAPSAAGTKAVEQMLEQKQGCVAAPGGAPGAYGPGLGKAAPDTANRGGGAQLSGLGCNLSCGPHGTGRLFAPGPRNRRFSAGMSANAAPPARRSRGTCRSGACGVWSGCPSALFRRGCSALGPSWLGGPPAVRLGGAEVPRVSCAAGGDTG